MAGCMTISIASGKGGTGKTTLATNLSIALAQTGESVTYVDCDVEEPNGHIFLNPSIDRTKEARVLIPEIDLDKCNFCGKCSDICEYNALAVLNDKVLVFPSLCHSCGGCFHICPENAIREVNRSIGVVSSGQGRGVTFLEGRLNVGEAISPPVIKQAKDEVSVSSTVIIDAPPGTSCPVIESVSGTDFVLLVTEPTPFGLNDLELAVEMVRCLRIPFGVVINRSDVGDDRVERYCSEQSIDVLMRIPFDRKLAEGYSVGEPVLCKDSAQANQLLQLHNDVKKRINGC